MSPHVYWTLLVLTCIYALVRGGRDERAVAVVCLVASIVTAFVLSPWGQRYSRIETGEMVVDLFVLATFTLVALRSDRFWPLWVAGLQLTSSLAHLLKGINIELLPQAYAAATKSWSYPILLILLVGTWRSHQRRHRDEAARTT